MSGANFSGKNPIRFRFTRNDKIEVEGVPYRCLDTGEETYLLVRCDVEDAVGERFSISQLYELHQAGRLKYTPARNVFRAQNFDLDALAIEARERLLYRHFYCARFLDLEASGSTNRGDCLMHLAIAKIQTEYAAMEKLRQTKDGRTGTKSLLENQPSPSAVRRWLRAFQQHGIGGLATSYDRSGNRNDRLQPEVAALIHKKVVLYQSRMKPPKRVVLEAVEKDITALNAERSKLGQPRLIVPHQSAIDRAIAKLDKIETYAAREGREKAKRKFGAVYGGLATSRVLERVELDECRISLQIIKSHLPIWKNLSLAERDQLEKYRPWISLALDAHSRCVLGIRVVDTPTAEAARTTVRMAMEDKAELARSASCHNTWNMNGLPEFVVTDNGSAYRSGLFREPMASCEIVHSLTPVGSPQLRGRAERWFGTFQSQFLKNFSGFTFENVVARGDYDSQAYASLLRDELGWAMIRYIVDDYHQQPRVELGGRTPQQVWEQSVHDYGVVPPPPPERLSVIFGNRFHRKISNRGVTVFRCWYQSKELQELRRDDLDKEIELRIDPQDISAASVLTKKGWIVVPAVHLDGPETLTGWQRTLHAANTRSGQNMKLTRDIVVRTRAGLRKQALDAEKRAGIASPILTEDDAIKIDRDISHTFVFHAEEGEADDTPFIPNQDATFEPPEVESGERPRPKPSEKDTPSYWDIDDPEPFE